MLREVFSLGNAQVAAVEAPEGPVIIAGGPGTGKTLCAIARIATLIVRGARPDSIALLTATAQGSEEISRRIELLSANFEQRRNAVKGDERQVEQYRRACESAREIFVGTVRQYACRLLRHMAEDPHFTLWSESQAKEKIAQLARHVPGVQKVYPTDIQAFLLWYADNRSRLPGTPAAPPGQAFWIHLENLYSAEKRVQRVMDRDDLAPEALKRLEANPRLRADWARNDCRHLIVDGLQDISGAEYRLLTILAGPTRSITVTADPNERTEVAPSPDPLELFRLEFRYAEERRLELHYRGDLGLTETTNRFLGHPRMTGLRDQVLYPARPFRRGEQRVIEIEGPPQAMYQHVLDTAEEWVDDGQAWEDIACIFPSGFSIREALTELVRRDVPFTVRGDLAVANPRRRRDGGDSGRQVSDAPRIRALLSCLINPRDEAAFALAASVSPRHEPRPLNPEDFQKVCALSRELDINLVEAAQRHFQWVDRRSRTYTDLRHFTDAWRSLDQMRGKDLHDLCLAAHGMLQEARGGAGLQPPEDPMWETVLSLSRNMPRLYGEVPSLQLARFLDLLSPALHPGLGPLGRGRYRTSRRGLTLTTIEAARGLEWKTVFVIGASDQVMPIRLDTSLDRRWVEAQQRRLYVAATRPVYHLYFVISRRSGRGFDQTINGLMEILGSDVEHQQIERRM